jgi:predicted nuclease with TOPRIM domain
MHSSTVYVLNNDVTSVESITQMAQLLTDVKGDIFNLMHHNDELKHDLISKDYDNNKLKETIEQINKKNELNNMLLHELINRKLTFKERFFGKINI